MEDIVEVNTVAITRLGNGQHVNFHRSAYDLVNECEVAKIGITDAIKVEWNGNIGTEEEIGRESTADVLTKVLNKKDEERDKIITYIFSIIRGSRYSPESAEAEAAEKLFLVISPYGRLQREPLNEETAHVNGLLKDLKKTENAALMTTLRLTSALNKLETANAEFHNLSLQVVKSAKHKALPSAAEVRPKTDAVYERVVFMIRAAYLSGAAPIDRELIKTLVSHLNILIDKTNANYRQIVAERKAAAERKKDPNAPKKPKKPKKPKDDDAPDIHLPEEETGPKTPEGGAAAEGGGSATAEGGGTAPEIHLPEE